MDNIFDTDTPPINTKRDEEMEAIKAELERLHDALKPFAAAWGIGSLNIRPDALEDLSLAAQHDSYIEPLYIGNGDDLTRLQGKHLLAAFLAVHGGEA